MLKATAGTLALLGDNDYPYAVPISYVYHDGKLYFHSALASPDAWQPLQSEPGRSPAEEIEGGLSRMLAIRFDIEHLTGKEAIELVRQHQK